VAVACKNGTQKAPNGTQKAVPTALMPTLPTAPYSDISVVVFRQSFEAPVPDTMSPFARHKRGCGGTGSFGPGPCCPSTIQGRRALVSFSEATKTLVSLLSQGQTSAHAQEEGLTLSSLWLIVPDEARALKAWLCDTEGHCPWCREAKTLMSSPRPERWNSTWT